MRLWLASILVGSFSVHAFDWQGHRGARGLHPENTIRSMQKALEYPAISTLELDVVVSKDSEVVVSHEPWMSEEICQDKEGNPVKAKEVNLYKLTYEEIKTYDCGTKPHPRFPKQVRRAEFKPLLADLVKYIEEERNLRQLPLIQWNIEIKSDAADEKDSYQPDYKKMSDIIMRKIAMILSPSRVTIQSFDWRVLQHLRRRWPEYQLVALREAPYTPEQVKKELGFMPAVFSPDYQLLHADHVKWFHSHGVKVIPWTVNERSAMESLKKMGVDGIITDYPNLIKD